MTQEDVIRIVCDICGIEPQDLQKRSRREPLPTARALITHFLHRELRMLPGEILPLIGHRNRSRTSVYHYLGRGTLVEEQEPFHEKLKIKADLARRMIDTIR